MILSAHQVEHLPYCGFFNKMKHSDVFVLLDHLPFSRGTWQNRNTIRIKNGEIVLTVPVHKGSLMCDTLIDNKTKWTEKHWKSIYYNYKNASNFSLHEEFFKSLYNKKWNKLFDLNVAIINYIKDALDIDTKLITSKEYNITTHKTDMLIDLCNKVGADTYLSGSGGHSYLDEEKFRENNIKLTYTNFIHPVYRQQFDFFVFDLSVIDYLFNGGKEL